MYTNIPGVQIIISLLKQHNIRHLVISPGTRNTALVHSVECDDFFKCYSVVDERSAGYFALGLSENLGVPVCVTCTAATATCNYLPAMKEAFERNIQLVALTADQDVYSRFHMGDQNINQTNMFEGYVKYAVDVPKIINGEDHWYFNRCVNEAFLELNHNGKGPIQINYRMNYSLDELATFPEKEIKKTRKITRYNEEEINYKDLSNELNNKKVLVFCGSDYTGDEKLKNEILKFKKKTGAVILADYYSNIIDDEVINPSILGDVYCNKDWELLKPDLIILTGTNIYAPIKYNANLFRNNITTWQISVDGMLNDGFKNVSKIIEGTAENFFEKINKELDSKTSDEYYQKWKEVIDTVKYENLEFTHLSIIKKLMETIPEKSLMHMSVLDAIRISNYYKMPSNVKCFANIGADGIDGALSTFLGQAANTKDLAFLLVGDLSLLYDMNGFYQELPSNVRILIINNYAGSEFHKNFGLEKIPTLNKHIAAGHNSNMSYTETMTNLEYISATNEEELSSGLNKLCNKDSKRPIILEVFTDAHKDATKLKGMWTANRENFMTDKDKFKKKIKNILGPKVLSTIKKLLRRG